MSDDRTGTHRLNMYMVLKDLQDAGVILKLRPARGPDFYAGIEVIFPREEPLYFSLDVAKDPRE